MKTQRKIQWIWTLIVGSIIVCLSIGKSATLAEEDDLRAYQHGIDFVPLPNGNYHLIWASSGNPPVGSDADYEWTHDVYYATVNPANPNVGTVRTLIGKSGAQEPVSSDITDDDRIMVTMEDSWDTQNEVAQRYGVYNSSLSPVTDYPRMVLDGGHSGHVASVGTRFVVFYSEGWIDDGGIDDLGSGDDVMLKVYSSSGSYERSMNIAVGETTRDWWPLVAGSSHYAGLVWQRFVNGQEYSDLMVAVYNPANNTMIRTPFPIHSRVKYYTYDIQYIPLIDRFLVTGALHNGGGFIYLLDTQGNIKASITSLPHGIVRESQAIVEETGVDSVTIVYPKAPSGLMVLSATTSNVTLDKVISDDYNWQYMGTDGIFTQDGRVYIVSLSSMGLVQKIYDIGPILTPEPTPTLTSVPPSGTAVPPPPSTLRYQVYLPLAVR